MSPLKWCTISAAALVAACASTPPVPSASLTEATQGAATGATALAAATSEVNSENVLVLDANNQNPGSVVSCRDMLQVGSNVIKTRCMSRDGWKRYERQLELHAQQMLRQMQGSGYR